MRRARTLEGVIVPIYEEEGKLTREDLLELRKWNKCKVCGGMLNVFLDVNSGRVFLACNDWHGTHHEGIEREPSRYEKEGVAALNIPTRREMMVEELGEEKATKLEKYQGVVALTRVQAMDILKTIWPRAPEIEVLKAAIICHQYGLNPLMKHIFLIPFKKRKEGKVVGEDWAIVHGISSNRLIARRRHNYSYLDMTPRRMTEEEQEKVNGEVDDTKVWAMTKLRDLDTGAEDIGVGSWPMDEVPYGAEKGNTKLNMACTRSEREALDRLYPAEMPQGVEVMEEKYVELPLVAEGGEKVGGRPGKEGGEGKASAATLSPTKETQKTEAPAAEVAVGEGFTIDLQWLKESQKALKWTDDTCKTFLISKYKVSPQGTLTDVIKRLTREQAEDFVNEINRRLEKQTSLF